MSDINYTIILTVAIPILVVITTGIFIPVLKDLILDWIKGLKNKGDYVSSKRPFIDATMSIIAENETTRLISLHVINNGNMLAGNIKSVIISDNFMKFNLNSIEFTDLAPGQKFTKQFCIIDTNSKNLPEAISAELTFYYDSIISRKQYNYISRFSFTIDTRFLSEKSIAPSKPASHKEGVLASGVWSDAMGKALDKSEGTFAFWFTDNQERVLSTLFQTKTKELIYDSSLRLYILSRNDDSGKHIWIYQLPDDILPRHHIAVTWTNNATSFYVNGIIRGILPMESEQPSFIKNEKPLMKSFPEGTLSFWFLDECADYLVPRHLISYMDDNNKTFLEVFLIACE